MALTLRAVIDLYLNDEVLANKEFTMFSVNPKDQHKPSKQTDFRLYSDWRIDRASHLEFRAGRGIQLFPKADTPRINLKQLKELFLSKDLNRIKELEWASQGNCKFLDGEDING